jgi:hypothetical protein
MSFIGSKPKPASDATLQKAEQLLLKLKSVDHFFCYKIENGGYGFRAHRFAMPRNDDKWNAGVWTG